MVINSSIKNERYSKNHNRQIFSHYQLKTSKYGKNRVITLEILT